MPITISPLTPVRFDLKQKAEEIVSLYTELASQIESLGFDDVLVSFNNPLGVGTNDVFVRIVASNSTDKENKNLTVRRILTIDGNEPEKSYLKNSLLEIGSGSKNAGLSNLVNEYGVKALHKIGGTAIKVVANITDGAYVWLRKGYVPDGNPVEVLSNILRQNKNCPKNLLARVDRLNPSEFKEFVTSEEFREYKEWLYRTDWKGSLDITDERSVKLLTKKSFKELGIVKESVVDTDANITQSANDKYLDAMIRHQIGLSRLSASMKQRIIELLDATEPKLREEIEKRMSQLVGRSFGDTITERRLQALKELIESTRGKAFDSAIAGLNDELKDLTVAEAQFVAGTANSVMPVVLETVVPATPLLHALVSTNPFEGRVLKEWAAGLKAADSDRILQTIRIAMVQGSTPQQTARAVFGTISLGKKDAAVEMTRKNVESVVRTAVNHFSNQAKQLTYAANPDLYEWELFVATLDSRTTLTCMAEDGKKYRRGEGRIPPLHFACRSLRVAILSNGLPIGMRPMKPYTERMLLDEYNAKYGTEAKSRDSLPKGHKGKFDDYAGSRVRELIGRTPASTNYGEFLQRQTESFQREVLGSTRYELWKTGKVSLDKFTDGSGRIIKVADLKQIYDLVN
jgi:hypothetical protein